MTHTPGPWEITGIDRVYSGEVIKHGNDWIAVLSDFNRFDRDAEREANARLIAAAPDLLEALRKVKQVLAVGRNVGEDKEQAYQDAEEIADCAIAKSEGKS